VDKLHTFSDSWSWWYVHLSLCPWFSFSGREPNQDCYDPHAGFEVSAL